MHLNKLTGLPFLTNVLALSMRTRILIPVAVLFCSLLSCHQKGNKDQYYTDHGEWDDVRLPLIKPYEAVRLNGEKDWFVQSMLSEDSTILFSAPGSQQMNIVNGTIFLYSVNTLVDGVEVKQAWHVLIPAKHIQKSFTSYFAYQDYVHYIGYRTEPKLHLIDKAAEYQGANDTIEWHRIKD